MTVRVMLTSKAPAASTYADIADTELAAGNSYETGGKRVTETGAVFTARDGRMGPFQYAVYYDETDGRIIAAGNYGMPIVLNQNDTFWVPASNGFKPFVLDETIAQRKQDQVWLRKLAADLERGLHKGCILAPMDIRRLREIAERL